MKQITEPIHRWCWFSDSWPPSAVNKILSMIDVGPRDWIWDPFGGAGTTALVASDSGIRSVTSDIDPLAILVSRIKADPPDGRTLEAASWDDAQEMAQLVAYLKERAAQSPSKKIRTMRFLIATALLRSNWHLGAKFIERRVRNEYSQLKSEILSDHHLRTSKTRIWVYQSDFRTAVPLVRQATKGRAVMITSPPFIASNHNPQLLKLQRAIGLVKRASPIPEITSTVYQRMLAQLATVAGKAGCRTVAVELSARTSNLRESSEWPPEFLARKLERAGYKTLISVFNSDKNDPSVLCVGRLG